MAREVRTSKNGLLGSIILASGRSAWLVIVITVMMNLLMLTIPIYSLQIYDRVLTSHSIATLVFLTLIACILIAAYGFLEWIRLRVLLRLGNRFELAYAERLLNTCITQSARFSNPSSALLRDLAVIRSFIASPQGVVTLVDVPVAILFVVVVFLISPVLGAAMLFGGFVLLVVATFTDKSTMEPIRLGGEAAQKAQFRSAEIVERSELVEALGMRHSVIAHWQGAALEGLHYQSRSADWIAANTAVSRWARLVVSIAMTALGAYLAIHNEITMGAMIAASILMGRGLAPLENVISLWRQVINVRLAWRRVSDALVISCRPENTVELPAPVGHLSLEKVLYAPPGAEQPTIKGVSFEIPAGRMLGLVGPVAAGKSTLAKLICGVWRPGNGVIRLDGADVFLWQREDFGKHIGYLPQGTELLAGSVRDNIARFSDCDDSTVIEAASLADVHNLILRLPNGYDTLIGPGGMILSGGTRQRIGLARALFGSPCLLVLDEPSSGLDTEGEKALILALRLMRAKGTTIVVVSHQNSILRDADAIAVLVDGQLHKLGPRRELLPLPGDSPSVQHALEAV
ncbi:MAG: type I secretion system permease/ATPase [bacterium]|nr:type I secretion system permease/ATPase [bacterium]